MIRTGKQVKLNVGGTPEYGMARASQRLPGNAVCDELNSMIHLLQGLL